MGLALIAAPVSAGDELSRRDTAALIKALASPDFDHRERAERELLQRGPGVEDACRAALRSASDIEQRLRLERVVERLPLATVLGVDPALALVEKPTLDGVFEALPKLSGVAIGERSGRELAENLLQALQWPEKLRTHLLDQRKLFDLCSRVVRGRATGLGWILVVLLEHEAFLQDDLVVEALGRLPGGAFRGILEQVLVGGDGEADGVRQPRDHPGDGPHARAAEGRVAVAEPAAPVVAPAGDVPRAVTGAAHLVAELELGREAVDVPVRVRVRARVRVRVRVGLGSGSGSG